MIISAGSGVDQADWVDSIFRGGFADQLEVWVLEPDLGDCCYLMGDPGSDLLNCLSCCQPSPCSQNFADNISVASQDNRGSFKQRTDNLYGNISTLFKSTLSTIEPQNHFISQVYFEL